MTLIEEKRKARRNPRPSATFSVTNPTWTDLDTNPGLRGEKLATNSLRYGTV
jgi:hypothetical protein